jgi:hypothetical protein
MCLCVPDPTHRESVRYLIPPPNGPEPNSRQRSTPQGTVFSGPLPCGGA